MEAESQGKKPEENGRGITRRDFSRVIALVAATAAVPGTSAARTGEARLGDKTASPPPESGLQSPTLSPISEAQVQIVFARYGNRLNEEQKAEVKRLIAAAQKASDDLHAFHLDNSDEPVMIFSARQTEG
jgi:hypothetical protein